MKNKTAVYAVAIGLSVASGISFATTDDTQFTKKTSKTIKTESNLDKHAKPSDRRNSRLEAKLDELNKEVSELKSENKVEQGARLTSITKDQDSLSSEMAVRYSHGLPVVASPFIGVRSPYDLIVNFPSLNEDLVLMKKRMELEEYAKEHGEVIPDRPLIDLSGDVEGEYHYTHDYTGPSKQDLDVNEVKLDVVGEISRWATAATIFEYENNPPISGARDANSRVKLGRGFLTIGNLDKNPLYFTLGQIYVPFGTYTNYMISDPVTQTLGRIKARAAELGFYKCGLNASLYAFKDDTYVHNPDAINTWGGNLSYTGGFNKFTYGLGVGYVSNIADSKGIQVTDGEFPGFGDGNAINYNSNWEHLRNYVPAANFNANIGYGPFTLLGEHVRTLRSFNISDMSFDDHAAMPTATDLELAYSFSAWGKDSTAAIGASATTQALAINLPQKSCFATAATSLWRYTIESVELRHDRNYSLTSTASGAGLPSFHPTNGRRDSNVITAKIGVYF